MSSSLRRSNLLIILWLSISIFGILSIYSASMPELIVRGSLPFSMALVQIIVFIACVLLLVVLLKMKKKSYNLVVKLVDPIFYFSIISLILVQFIGSERGGAKMVIDLFILDYQPVELYKIAVILYMAKHLTGKNKPRTFSELMLLCIKAGSGCVLLILQPDFGGMVIVVGLIYLVACLYGEFMSTIIKISLTGISAIVAFVMFGGFNKLLQHQSGRFTAWFDPFSVAKDEGWGAVQALIAISNGDINGTGYLGSIQKTIFKTGAATDYIFVIICEEWGLIGAIFVIGSLSLLAYVCILVGNSAKNRFGMIYSYGFGLLILLQLFVNIGGVTNLIPMTGVTLPFISNGINSFVLLSIGLFIVIIIDHEAVRERRKLNEQSERLFL